MLLLGFFHSDARFLQATTAALSSRILRHQTDLGKLRIRHLVEQPRIRWNHLPLVAKLGEVIQHCHSISSIRVAGPEITRHSNGVAECLFALALITFTADKLLEGQDLDALAGDSACSDRWCTLCLSLLWFLDGDWEATKTIRAH